MKHSRYEQFINGCGLPLTESEGGELALTKADALKAVEILADCQIGVLGGDVYELESDGYLRPTYDSWYCEKSGLTSSEFVYLSVKKATQYLHNYEEPTGIKIRYFLVIDIF